MSDVQTKKTFTVTTALGDHREVSHTTWEMYHYAKTAEASVIESLFEVFAHMGTGPRPTSIQEIPERDHGTILALADVWVQLRSITGVLENFAD